MTQVSHRLSQLSNRKAKKFCKSFVKVWQCLLRACVRDCTGIFLFVKLQKLFLGPVTKVFRLCAQILGYFGLKVKLQKFFGIFGRFCVIFEHFGVILRAVWAAELTFSLFRETMRTFFGNFWGSPQGIALTHSPKYTKNT